MDNNDVLRRIRYTFNFNDSKIIAIFGLGNLEVSRAEISDWLKRDEDPAYKECGDKQLAMFLNGFIIKRRGKKDDQEPRIEDRLNNNIVFNKLKIALNLKADDILDIFKLAEFSISKSELSSFFRKDEHRNYSKCKDQVLRNFLKGMQIKYRIELEVKNGEEK